MYICFENDNSLKGRKNYPSIIATLLALVVVAACEKPGESGHAVPGRAVDLGLSVRWADCNLGANSPEASGDYFAWGETETKAKYAWDNYKWNTAEVQDTRTLT